MKERLGRENLLNSWIRVDVFLGVNLLSREGNCQTGDRMSLAFPCSFVCLLSHCWYHSSRILNKGIIKKKK